MQMRPASFARLARFSQAISIIYLIHRNLPDTLVSSSAAVSAGGKHKDQIPRFISDLRCRRPSDNTTKANAIVK
jgi:hypothetical protein